MTTAIGSSRDRAMPEAQREPSAGDWMRLVVHPGGDFALTLRERASACDEVCSVSITASGATTFSFQRT